jgi:phospholipid:diacylglycerol acyltransferase
VLEKFLSRKERANLFRRWPGSASMWMKGGDRIWGNLTWAADDPANCTDTLGRFFSFRQTSDSGPNSSQKPKSEDLDAQHIQPNLTMNEAGAYTLIHTPQEFQKMYTSNYSNGFVVDTATLKANGRDHRKVSGGKMLRLLELADDRIAVVKSARGSVSQIRE